MYPRMHAGQTRAERMVWTQWELATTAEMATWGFVKLPVEPVLRGRSIVFVAQVA
jgi:hypothetical protein